MRSAGLSGVRLAWSGCGDIWFPEDILQGDIDAVLAVYEAHDPATQLPEVFAPLSPWQVRQALNISQHRNAVEAMIAASNIEIKDAWQFATEFQRNNDMLVQMTAALGMTSEAVDALFRLGATLQPQNL